MRNSFPKRQLPTCLILLVVVFACFMHDTSQAFVVRHGVRESGASPTYAAATLPQIRPVLTTSATAAGRSSTIGTTTATALSMAASTADTEETTDSSSDSLKDVDSMRIGEIKQELESYGISTKAFLEKSELVAELKKARADGLKPKAKPQQSATTSSTSSSSTDTNRDDQSGKSREERLQEEIVKCQAMKNSELKKELTERGISTASFLEKEEFVKALAEARVDGVTAGSGSGGGGGKSSSAGEGYAEYKEVEVLTSDDAGPRPKQSARDTTQQSPFGGGSPFGAGGMGGMGGIADMLKNMGMGGPGAVGVNPFAGAGANPFGGGAGANPFAGGMGGMGGMGDVMGKAQEMMKNPKVREIMAKAQSNPKVMAAMQECMSNPSAFAKYQNDPEVGELMNELKKYM